MANPRTVPDALLALHASQPEPDLLAALRRSCMADLEQLQASFEREDLCSFMEAAYSICTASRAFGAARLALACEAIESAGRAHLASIDAGNAADGAFSRSARDAYRCFKRELAALR